MTDLVYLDHNATTPIAAPVFEAMLPWLREGSANPSSDHAPGRRARRAIERAREHVAALVGAKPEEIVFTSGGTEADNLAVLGVARARPERRQVVTSMIEHPAVARPCEILEADGLTVTRLPVGPDGSVSPDDAAGVLSAGTALLTVMLANNETGALQPVRRLAGLAHGHGAVVHSDAAQAVGKVQVDVDDLGVDLLTIAGHKLCAPKGVGALYLREGTPIVPVLYGAGHERGLRPGTENVASIVALGEACRLAAADLEAEATRLGALRDRLAEALTGRVPGLRVTIPLARSLPNTLHVRFPGASGTSVLARAPQVAASTGSACHAGVEHPSTVLLAMGLDPEDALGAVRLSLGRTTRDEDIERAAAALARAWEIVSA